MTKLRGVRCTAWISVVALLIATGCYTRSQVVSEEERVAQRDAAELYILERLQARWAYRRPTRPLKKRPDQADGHYLHIGGSATCSGWFRKTQTTHVYAWATRNSPTGPIVPLKILNVGFDYSKGIFDGAGVSHGEKGVEEVSAHDTISGLDRDICQCVRAYAFGTVSGRTHVRTYDTICPEGVTDKR